MPSKPQNKLKRSLSKRHNVHRFPQMNVLPGAYERSLLHCLARAPESICLCAFARDSHNDWGRPHDHQVLSTAMALKAVAIRHDMCMRCGNGELAAGDASRLWRRSSATRATSPRSPSGEPCGVHTSTCRSRHTPSLGSVSDDCSPPEVSPPTRSRMRPAERRSRRVTPPEGPSARRYLAPR